MAIESKYEIEQRAVAENIRNDTMKNLLALIQGSDTRVTPPTQNKTSQAFTRDKSAQENWTRASLPNSQTVTSFLEFSGNVSSGKDRKSLDATNQSETLGSRSVENSYFDAVMEKQLSPEEVRGDYSQWLNNTGIFSVLRVIDQVRNSGKGPDHRQQPESERHRRRTDEMQRQRDPQQHQMLRKPHPSENDSLALNYDVMSSSLTFTNETLNESALSEKILKLVESLELQTYQLTVVNNWDGMQPGDEDMLWSFAGSMLYSVTVITTIGESCASYRGCISV